MYSISRFFKYFFTNVSLIDVSQHKEFKIFLSTLMRYLAFCWRTCTLMSDDPLEASWAPVCKHIPQFHDYFTLIGVQIFNVYEGCFPPCGCEGGVCSLLCFVNYSSCCLF